MSYCIAFSKDGATDVTRRYVRNATTQGTERNKCPEEVLLYIIDEIRRMRRADIDKDDRKNLIIQDEREEKELRGYVIRNLAEEIGRMIPLDSGARNIGGGPGGAGVGTAIVRSSPASGDINQDDKLPSRRTGTQAWKEARGEAGNPQISDVSDPSAPPSFGLPPGSGFPPGPREGH